MGSLNKAIILGNVGNDPEVKDTQGNSRLAKLSIATNEKYQNRQGETVEDTEWHRVVAWGRLADVIEQYVHKGSQLLVEGKLRTRQWEDDNGVKHYMTEIHAFTVQLCGGGGGGGSGARGRSGARTPSVEQAPSAPRDNTPAPIDDDDLPF